MAYLKSKTLFFTTSPRRMKAYAKAGNKVFKEEYLHKEVERIYQDDIDE